MQLSGTRGAKVVANGTESTIRLNQDGAICVQDAHGKYQEAVLNGRVWTMPTAVAGVTVAANQVIAAATNAPIVGLFNPINSGVNLVILQAYGLWNSGTPGASGLVWGIVPPGTAVTATGGNAAINNLSFVTGGSVAKTFTASTMTGAIASVFLRNVAGGGPFAGAIAATSVGTTQAEDTSGSIICPPGACIGIYAGAAGTSPIITASITWEEVPIV